MRVREEGGCVCWQYCVVIKEIGKEREREGERERERERSINVHIGICTEIVYMYPKFDTEIFTNL